ncbi:MAG: heavy-metal-associated domain-containing protein [Lewinella sp.]|nr:heavy-metal-associated domain-containing protein [Lewinella sp.]
MAKMQFKTNINCNNCVRAVTGFLNEVEGIENWQVDIDNPDKILTVEGKVTIEQVVEAVEDAGYDLTVVEA